MLSFLSQKKPNKEPNIDQFKQSLNKCLDQSKDEKLPQEVVDALNELAKNPTLRELTTPQFDALKLISHNLYATSKIKIAQYLQKKAATDFANPSMNM